MESIVGGRSGITSAYLGSSSTSAVADLFSDLQRESAEQALFTLAALDYYEQKLLDALLPDRASRLNLSDGHAPS